MFQFYADFAEYFRDGRDVALSRALNPRLENFRMWLAGNASRIPM